MAALAAVLASLAAMAWVRGREGRLAPLLRALRTVLAASLMTTESLLLVQGRWREALPLHLCSLSALCALALPAAGGQGRLDFLFYLGMPGALLALLFPAPALSRWQALLDASYYTTHALILLMPLVCLSAGRRIRRGRALRLFCAMQGAALCAYAVNLRLGTDYLFLMAPPAGTPLEVVFSWGRIPYLLVLEALLGALLLVTGRLLPTLCPACME